MTDLSYRFERYIRLAEDHERRDLLRAYDRIILFSISDAPSFALKVDNGQLLVFTDVDGLDWRGDDWASVSCLRTSESVLNQIILGELLPTEAFVLGRLGWASRGLASPELSNRNIYRWLCQIFRMANEVATSRGRQLVIGA